MSKNYNLSKKSDMRRFQKDFKQHMYDLAKESLSNESFEINCPNCNQSIEVHEGINTCDFCSKEIDVDLEFNF